MHFGDWATWFGSAGTITASVAVITIAAQANRRERRRAFAELHYSLTTGETAHARNVMGSLLYAELRDLPARSDSIDAYFRLIWALQRARNIFRTHGAYSKALSGPTNRVKRLWFRNTRLETEATLTWNLDEIAENVVRFHDRYTAPWRVQDHDAWAEVEEFVDLDDIRARIREAV